MTLGGGEYSPAALQMWAADLSGWDGPTQRAMVELVGICASANASSAAKQRKIERDKEKAKRKTKGRGRRRR